MIESVRIQIDIGNFESISLYHPDYRNAFLLPFKMIDAIKKDMLLYYLKGQGFKEQKIEDCTFNYIIEKDEKYKLLIHERRWPYSLTLREVEEEMQDMLRKYSDAFFDCL